MSRFTSPKSLAREILRIVEENVHYDQGHWISGNYFPPGTVEMYGTGLRKVLAGNVCGTTGCVAGNAVILSMPAKAKVNFIMDEVRLPDGTERSIEDYARDALGLEYCESTWLFSGERSLEDVKRALQAIIDGDRVSDVMPEYDIW